MSRAERRQAQRDAARQSEQPLPRVCIATLYPTNAPPTGPTFDCWSNLLTLRPGIDIAEVISVSGSLVAAARNVIAAKFLATDADWLFSVDSDMSFDPGVPAALIAHADAHDRPILGALAFKVSRTGELEPTLYRIATEPNTHLRVVREWQRGALARVDATGAACIVVQRRVFEAMTEPYYEPGELCGELLGEDISWCLSARSLGFDIHVATGVDVGHVKPRIYGLADWDRQCVERDAIPTYVVVPVRQAGDSVPITALGPGIAGIIAVPNVEGEPVNIPQKWNKGLAWAFAEARAEGHGAWNVLFVNDDVVFDDDVLPIGQLAVGLRSSDDHWIAYPNVHDVEGDHVVATSTDDYAGQTISGWCFMVRGESALPFDESFPWWYSDSDLERRVRDAGGKVVSVLDCHVEHLRPMQSTRGDLLEQAYRDEATYAAKWGIDPSTLWLARHGASLTDAV